MVGPSTVISVPELELQRRFGDFVIFFCIIFRFCPVFFFLLETLKSLFLLGQVFNKHFTYIYENLIIQMATYGDFIYIHV